MPNGSAHLHDFLELVIVEEGHASHRVDGQVVEVQPGDVTWIAPGQIHDACDLHTCSYWLVAFGAEAVSLEHTDAVSFSSQPSSFVPLSPFAPVGRRRTPRISLSPEELRAWRPLLERLERELRERRSGYAEACRSALRLLLLELARKLESEGTGAPAVEPGQQALMGSVFAFIEERYRRPIGLRDVARAVARSPAHLTDVVRRVTGRTVLQWITERRLAEAQRMLLASDEPLESIARAVGYADARHLQRLFRRSTGTAPREWRRVHLAAGVRPGMAAPAMQ